MKKQKLLKEDEEIMMKLSLIDLTKIEKEYLIVLEFVVLLIVLLVELIGKLE